MGYSALFLDFSCLIFLARNSSTMLSRSGESGHLCLVLDIKGKAFNLSLLSIMLVAGLLYMAFIMLRKVSYIPNLLRGFIMTGCWNLSDDFCHLLRWSWFSSFILLMWYITFIDLHRLNHPCIPGINPTQSWCMILLMCCCICFASIL